MPGRFMVVVCALSIGLPTFGGAPARGQGPCLVPNVGGTVMLPPQGCAYLTADQVHMLVNGLPPGTTIELAPIHQNFICRQGGQPCVENGGTLGGQIERFDSQLVLAAQGTGPGPIGQFNRTIVVPLEVVTHTAPRTPGQPVQTFDTDMFSIHGSIVGDPDFDLLAITGGTNNAAPSPGRTSLTLLPSGEFRVDSFFDVSFSISFLGAPGSIFEGIGGTTSGTVRMVAGFGPLFTDGFESGDPSSWSNTVPP